MLQPDYVVRVHDMMQPMAKAINRSHIACFRAMLARESHFAEWLHRHSAWIVQIYRESPRRVAEVLRDYLAWNPETSDRFTPDNRHLKSSQPIRVMAGGMHDDDAASDSIMALAVIFYLFSPHIIDLAMLPKPHQAHPLADQANLLGGQPEPLVDQVSATTRAEMIADLSGREKQHMRRVYQLRINHRPAVLKIQLSIPKYQSEFDIYHELMSTADYGLTVKIYNRQNRFQQQANEFVFRDMDQNLLGIDQFSIKCDDLALDIAFMSREMIYILTEHDTSYVPALAISHTYTYAEKCLLLRRLVCGLRLLAERYGFAHWDFHSSNIFLCLHDKTKYKIYDFDQSGTRQHPESSFFQRQIRPYLLESVDNPARQHWLREMDYDSIVAYGRIYDLVRFCYTFLSDQEINMTNLATYSDTIMRRLMSQMGHFLRDSIKIQRQARGQLLDVHVFIHKIFLPGNLAMWQPILDDVTCDDIRGGSRNYRRLYLKYYLKYHRELDNY